MNKVKLSKAIDTLRKELQRDKGYYEGWRSNIAMSYIDAENQYKEDKGKNYLNEEDKHAIANLAADNFLKLLLKG